MNTQINASVEQVEQNVAQERANLALRLKETQELTKKLNALRVALCPRLATEELSLIVAHEASVEVFHDDAAAVQELRKNRQMSDEDKDQIAAAKLRHKKLINTPEIKSEACEMMAKAYLSQYRLTHKKDGRIGVSIRGQI